MLANLSRTHSRPVSLRFACFAGVGALFLRSGIGFLQVVGAHLWASSTGLLDLLRRTGGLNHSRSFARFRSAQNENRRRTVARLRGCRFSVGRFLLWCLRSVARARAGWALSNGI